MDITRLNVKADFFNSVLAGVEFVKKGVYFDISIDSISGLKRRF